MRDSTEKETAMVKDNQVVTLQRRENSLSLLTIEK